MNDVARLTNNPSKLSYIEVLGRHGVAVKDYDLMEFVLTSNVILNKSSDYDFFLSWLGTGLLTAPGPKWKKRRRIITPAFHFSILEQFVDIFESNGKILLQKLYNEAVDKESVDIYKYVTACALDIISETAMGVNVKTQENKNQDYVFAVKDMCRLNIVRSTSAWRRMDFLHKFTDDYQKEKKYLQILHGFANSVIQQKKRELENRKPNEKTTTDDFGRKRKMAFLDLLLNATIDGKPLSQEDIREEVDTFMFEGHDTTSSGISSTLYLLANHQEIQKKVREEQKNIYGNDRDAPTTYQHLQDMKYLELVIKETLRLFPPVPFIGRLLTEDVKYKDHIIPKNTVITLFIYGINRDPDFHESPDEFKPERFLHDGKKPFSYVPFSAGARNCIGQKFALLEMKSMISKIIRNFELYPTNPPHKLELASEAVLKSINGVKLRLKKHGWAD